MFDDTTILSEHNRRPGIVVVGMATPGQVVRCHSVSLGGMAFIMPPVDSRPAVKLSEVATSFNSTCCATIYKKDLAWEKPKGPFWRALPKYRRR